MENEKLKLLSFNGSLTVFYKIVGALFLFSLGKVFKKLSGEFVEMQSFWAATNNMKIHHVD